jgi:hypothetical protein
MCFPHTMIRVNDLDEAVRCLAKVLREEGLSFTSFYGR